MKYFILKKVYEHVATYDTEEKAEEVLDQLGRDYMNSFGEFSPYFIEEYEEDEDA
jgi:dGTP triphosphohydrolase